MNGFVPIIQLNFYFCIFCDIGMNANLIWLICYDVLKAAHVSGLNRNRLFRRSICYKVDNNWKIILIFSA